MFPEDEQGFAIDDQYYVGDSGLLVKPVVKEGAEETSLYIAEAQPYYNYFTHEVYDGKAGRQVTIPTPLSTQAVLLRGGSILPVRQRVRRSSPLMWQDPYTLIVALDKNLTARGELYSDDGLGYGYTTGEYIHRGFIFQDNRLTSVHLGENDGENNAWAQLISHIKIERIVVLGLQAVRGVTVAGSPVEFAHDDDLVIKHPGVGIVEGWQIVIE